MEKLFRILLGIFLGLILIGLIMLVGAFILIVFTNTQVDWKQLGSVWLSVGIGAGFLIEQNID
jgi:hypothetical protein